MSEICGRLYVTILTAPEMAARLHLNALLSQFPGPANAACTLRELAGRDPIAVQLVGDSRDLSPLVLGLSFSVFMIDLGYLRKRLKIVPGPLEVRTRSQEHHAIFAINFAWGLQRGMLGYQCNT